MINALFLLTVVLLEEGVFEGGVVVLPMRVELMELVC